MYSSTKEQLVAAIFHLAETPDEEFEKHTEAVEELFKHNLAEWSMDRIFFLNGNGQKVYERLKANQPVSDEMWDPHDIDEHGNPRGAPF